MIKIELTDEQLVDFSNLITQSKASLVNVRATKVDALLASNPLATREDVITEIDKIMVMLESVEKQVADQIK